MRLTPLDVAELRAGLRAMKHGTLCIVGLHDRAPVTGTYLAPQWIAGQRVATVAVNGERLNFLAEIVTECGGLIDALDHGSLPSPHVGRA